MKPSVEISFLYAFGLTMAKNHYLPEATFFESLMVVVPVYIGIMLIRAVLEEKNK